MQYSSQDIPVLTYGLIIGIAGIIGTLMLLDSSDQNITTNKDITNTISTIASSIQKTTKSRRRTRRL